jgi:hypothetical protein
MRNGRWWSRTYTGEQAAQEAAQHGIKLEVVKLPEVKRGFGVASSPLGGGAEFCLDDPLSASRARL